MVLFNENERENPANIRFFAAGSAKSDRLLDAVRSDRPLNLETVAKTGE